MSETNGSKVGSVVVGLAIGATLGAAVALLYAPRSGKNTRGMLADKGRKLRVDVEGVLKDGKGFVRDQKAVLSAAVEGGKEAMREERAEQKVPA